MATRAIVLNEVIVTTVATETTEGTDTEIVSEDVRARQATAAAVAMIEKTMRTLLAEATETESGRIVMDESVAEIETGIETEARVATAVMMMIEVAAGIETTLMTAVAATAAKMHSLDRSAVALRPLSRASQRPT